jgi:hypothetical protein
MPVYGWTVGNWTSPSKTPLARKMPTDDHYEFDLVHLFGGPQRTGQRAPGGERAGASIARPTYLDVR